MIVYAVLTVFGANEHADQPKPAGMIPLTCSNTRRLFTVLKVESTALPACPRSVRCTPQGLALRWHEQCFPLPVAASRTQE